MQPLLQDAAERAGAYLDGLAKRRVAFDPAAEGALDAFDTPLPDAPADAHAVLDQLDRFASPATTAMAGPRFFGFVIGGALPVSLAANWLATAWDQNSALYSGRASTIHMRAMPESESSSRNPAWL